LLQDELERQEKYPNLIEPHRLKALLVSAPLSAELAPSLKQQEQQEQHQQQLH
jgi:hypothetical protein